MKINLFIISVACVFSCVPSVHGTGLLKAKLAAKAKGAAMLGAGAMAMKGKLLKGAGALLSAKVDALKKVASMVQEDTGEEVSFEQQTVEEEPALEPYSITEPLFQFPIQAVQIESIPFRFPIRTLQVDSISPEFTIHTVQVENDPLEMHEKLKNKLSGVWSFLQKGFMEKKKAVGEMMQALKPPSVIKSPVVYKYVTAPRYYSVPIMKRIKV